MTQAAEHTAAASAQVSVLIFTLNEAVHLPGCLDSLDWCDDIVVVDSFSDDATIEIAERAGARCYQHRFEGFGSQRNWALDHVDLKHEWVLILDADERVTPDLASELDGIARTQPPGVGAYRVRRRFYLWGRWLKYSSLYPTWVVRFIHQARVRFEDRGHAETQRVEGLTLQLRNDLLDENLKGMDAWFERQNRYAARDAEYELVFAETAPDPSGLLSTDPLVRRVALKHLVRRLPGRAVLYFFYSYFFRLGFLEGRDGLVYCYMRATYQAMVEIKKYDIVRAERRRRSVG